MVFQHFNLFQHKTALENITMLQTVVLKRSQKEAEDIGRSLLERVGIGDRGDNYLPVVPADQPADIGERPAHVLQAERDAVEMGGVGIMAAHDTWPVSASLSISARHLS